MRMLVLSVAAALLVSGCASKVQLQSKFDYASVAPMLSPGKNKLSGSALIRQVGGGVVTCAGYPVYLMPASEYAREWARKIYKSESRGFFSTRGRGIVFTNLDPSFTRAVKEVTCNAQGFFSFPDVADGDFFLFTKINWSVGGEIQGGSVMRAVSLRGSESVDIVLSP
jgi:hypothetical protein